MNTAVDKVHLNGHTALFKNSNWYDQTSNQRIDYENDHRLSENTFHLQGKGYETN